MEKIIDGEQARRWTDHIPLQWKYTAGVAGERFLQLLKQGKLQASVCRSCNKLYLPPKIFCMDCFEQLNEWRDVPSDDGYIYSFTTIREGSEGERETLVLVKFEGVEGGLLGRLRETKGEKPRIGMKVRAVFKPKQNRKGDLSDIDYFEKVTV